MVVVPRDGSTKHRLSKTLAVSGTIAITAVYRGFPTKIVPPMIACLPGAPSVVGSIFEIPVDEYVTHRPLQHG